MRQFNLHGQNKQILIITVDNATVQLTWTVQADVCLLLKGLRQLNLHEPFKQIFYSITVRIATIKLARTIQADFILLL